MLRSENVKSENVTVGKCRIAVGNCHIGNSLSEIVLSKNVESEIVTESIFGSGYRRGGGSSGFFSAQNGGF